MSKKNELSKGDISKRLNNTLLFLIPALIVFLTAIASGISYEKALISVYLRGLNTMIDLLKKYQKDNTVNNSIEK